MSELTRASLVLYHGVQVIHFAMLVLTLIRFEIFLTDNFFTHLFVNSIASVRVKIQRLGVLDYFAVFATHGVANQVDYQNWRQ